MANLKVNNYHKLRFKINKGEYWDFFVNHDSPGCFLNDGEGGFYDKCLISYMDFPDSAMGDWAYSNDKYSWENSISLGHTLYNITYTGVDNGLFTFRRDRITNKDFLRIFQENKFEIIEDDYRLKLHAVSGNTLQYDYPLHVEKEGVKFNGGFYQGFFKTECDKYQVFPSKFEDGDVYNFEFTMKKCDLEKESTKTLNDKYPENKGIFFYIGTRAENKWVYNYDSDGSDGLDACEQLDMSDYVEGSEIDKKNHIIGNFFDLDLEFKEDPPIDLDDYLNFNYYFEDVYEYEKCGWDDMSDYLDVPVIKKPRIIDEDAPHEHMASWCCDGKTSEDKDYILRPYFVGCNCPIKYRKERIKTKDDEEPNFISGCIPFGEGDYIDDFDGLEEEDTDYVESEMDISDFEYYTDNGFNLAEANWYYFYTDNKFMMFDRTKNGKTVANWIEGTQYMYCGRKNNFKGNLFILMNRTKTGYTVSNIDSIIEKNVNLYDPYKDLYNNALAFRVTDKGEIGYRLLTIDCDKEGSDKTMMVEGYSFEGVIPSCEWFTVNVRITFLGGDKMKFHFYVDGKLVYITKELPRINLRELDDLYEKQEGVPYNISLGGGTQGLADTIQYNYMLDPNRVYPLEKYFGGTFIGYMKSFKVFNCFMEQMTILKNYKWESNNLYIA